MTIRQLSTRLEISFWQLVIQLLSESRTVQRMIAWVYHRGSPATARFINSLNAERALQWAAIGLALGFLAGLLAALI